MLVITPTRQMNASMDIVGQGNDVILKKKLGQSFVTIMTPRYLRGVQDAR